MSEENVELVRRCVSSWIRGDFDPEEFLAEDMQWHAAPEEPEAGGPVLRGRESVYETVTAWIEQFGPSDIEVTELLDCGNDVLVCSRMRLAGTVAWNPGYHLYTVTEDKVRCVRAFFHRDQALEAVGLGEQVMSEENVETVRRSIDAFNRGDRDAWLADFAPEAEWHTTGRFADAGVYRGRAGLERFWAELQEDIEELSVSVSAIRATGDRVFVAGKGGGRGKRSKARSEELIWYVVTLRDGRIVRVQGFATQEEALEAAGLRQQAMSEENVEIVRTVLSAWNRDEQESILDLLNPQIVFDATRREVNPKTYVGMEGMRLMLADRDEVWGEFRTEPHEFVDAGDRVVVIGQWVGKGKGSGIEVRQPTAHLFTVDAGRIVRWELGHSSTEALEAAGLAEQSMSQENVELVRRASAEYGLSVQGLRAFVRSGLVAPEAEFDISAVDPDAPIIHGVEGWLDFVEALPWGRSTRLEPERFFDVDDERVLVFIHVTVQGEGSGVPVEIGDGHEYTIRDGVFVRMKVYADRAEALEAAGLREQSKHQISKRGRPGRACNLRRSQQRWIIRRRSAIRTKEEERMPLIEARLLEGVFSSDEREQLAEGLINAVVDVKGRASEAKRKC